MKITINISESKIRRLARHMKKLEMPASAMPDIIRESFLLDNIFEGDQDDLLMPLHVYPNRAVAVRVAARLLRTYCHAVADLRFREGRRVVSVAWCTKDYLKSQSVRYEAVTLCPGMKESEAA